MEKGDIVECIEKCEGNRVSPPIFEGIKYVVNDILKCKCGIILLDVGLSLKDTSNTAAICLCGQSYKPFKKPFYDSRFFRKIEPNYKVVEVSESIIKKELVFN